VEVLAVGLTENRTSEPGKGAGKASGHKGLEGGRSEDDEE